VQIPISTAARVSACSIAGSREEVVWLVFVA